MSVDWIPLRMLGVTVRPIEPPAIPVGWERSSFRAGLATTVKLLTRELEQLDAERVALELDVTERDIRADGMPRADARLGSQAVRLSFDSKWGPLRYATGAYDDWRDNLRAIALSMQALRAVDRYGVSKRGEQYTGWKAIPRSTDPADAVQTREQAYAVLAPWDGDVKAALRATHPDLGGDPDDFRRVVRARDFLAGRSS